MGIAEREAPADNAVFTNMSARLVLEDAISAARRLGLPSDPSWSQIAENMYLPKRGKVVISHQGYRRDEEKGATPDPLMGIFPLGFPLEEEIQQATLAYYLQFAGDYIGSPMLSALYGVWGARTGERQLSADLLREGYANFCTGRFMQTLEYREDKFPDQPRAGPFFANLGGFLTSLILGFPRLQPGPTDPETWSMAPIVLPAGWSSIEIERVWIRGRPWRTRSLAWGR